MAITTHALRFATRDSDGGSELTLSDLVTGDLPDISWSLLERRFQGSGEFDSSFFDFDWNYDVTLGLELAVDLPSFGSFGVSYPVDVSFDAPSSLVAGESFTLRTGDDFALVGGSVSGTTLNFGGAKLNLTIDSKGAEVSDFALQALGIPLLEMQGPLFTVPAGNAKVPLVSVSPGYESDEIFDGVTFKVASPDGEKFSDPLTRGTPGALPTATGVTAEPLLTLTVNPVEAFDVGPLKLLDFLTEDGQRLFGTYGVKYEYALLKPTIGGGIGYEQRFSFDPSGIAVRVEIGGEVQTGQIGDHFNFSAPTADNTTEVRGRITYELQGDLFVEYTLLNVLQLGIEMLSGEIEVGKAEPVLPGRPMTNDSFDLPNGRSVSFGPAFELEETFAFGRENADFRVSTGAIRLGPSVLPPITYEFSIPVGRTPDASWNDPRGPFTVQFVDPLVFDLDRDGALELLPLARGVQFDIDIDGIAERIGWVSAQDGLLAIDRNGDGIINSAAELYGNANEDGFTVLARDDSNADGVIDARDPIFADLRFWRDLDGDGATDAGELSALGDFGVTAIPLANSQSWIVIEGNRIAFQGSARTEAGGVVGSMRIGAVFFATDQTVTSPIRPPGFTFDPEALLLPGLRGYGDLVDLRQAMTADTGLRDAVKGFVTGFTTFDLATVRGRFEQILFDWADVTAVDPASRGAHFDGRKLAFLEELHGIVFTGRGTTAANPDAGQAARFAALYDNVVDAMLLQFLAQLPAAARALGATQADLAGTVLPAFEAGLEFDALSNRAQADLQQLFSHLVALAPVDAQAGLAFWGKVAPLLAGLRLEQFDGNDAEFAAALDDALGAISRSYDRSLAEALTLGARRVEGTSEGQRLDGTSGRDILIGGAGNDTLSGGDGGDLYLLHRGDGDDRISDWSWRAGERDVVQFGPGITLSQIAVTQGGWGADLVISYGSGDRVTITDAVRSSTSRIEEFRFADGERLSALQMLDLSFTGTAGADRLLGDERDNALVGAGGNDTLDGGAGADTIAGGADADRLSGGDGNDTYLFELGSGADSILESQSWGEPRGLDTLVFGPGITPQMLAVSQTGSGSLLISIGPSDRVLLEQAIGNEAAQVERFRFADGTVLSFADLLDRSLGGTQAADRLLGDGRSNLLRGQAGNDLLEGGAGRDTLVGGTGNDSLYGGFGNDMYRFAIGDGADLIFETEDYGATDRDIIVFGDGIRLADLEVTQGGSGSDLVILVNAADRITLSGAVSWASRRVEVFRFADGDSRNFAQMLELSFRGTTQADRLIGTAGPDSISGGASNDTLDGGDGADTLHGGTGNDRLQGGLGNDTYLFNLGDGVEEIQETTAWNSTVDRDTLIFSAGITPGMLVVTQGGYGSDLQIAIGALDRIVIRGAVTSESARIEEFRFADGTTRTFQQIAGLSLGGTAANDRLNGDAGANFLNGQAGNDTLTAGAGDDTLAGGVGNDQLLGGEGSDVYLFNQGDGVELIVEAQAWGNTTDSDTLILGEGIALADLVVTQGGGGRDLVLMIGATDRIVIDEAVSTPSMRIETFLFSDGTTRSAAEMLLLSHRGTAAADQLRGTTGADELSGGGSNDTLEGDEGADTLSGGAGNDQLRGDAGAETYLFGIGDGADTITDNAAWGETTAGDTILFGAGITRAQLVVTQDTWGRDLIITVGSTTDRIAISNFIGSESSRIESFRFEDGTVLDAAAMLDLSFGGTRAADRMMADGRANQLHGQAGNDTLEGREGADTLVGGPGDDRLLGQEGSDTYLFEIGDGSDVIVETQAWNGTQDVDTIEFGAGITPAQIVVTQANWARDLVLSIGGADRIVLDGAVQYASARVEVFRFADGTTRSFADMLALSHDGTPAADRIAGDTGADRLSGWAGADWLSAGDGDDTLAGGAGNDTMEGGYGNDLYRVNLGEGVDHIVEMQPWGSAPDADVLEFGPGITPAMLRVSQYYGDDLIIGIGDGGDAVWILDAVTTATERVEHFHFADGTKLVFADILRLSLGGTAAAEQLRGDTAANVIAGQGGNDTLDGLEGDDTLTGGRGDDRLFGGYGSDTYRFGLGDGADRIQESQAWNNTTDHDRLLFGSGIVPTQIVVTRPAFSSDIVIAVAQGDSVTITGGALSPANGVESFGFADGTVLTLAQLSGPILGLSGVVTALDEGSAATSRFSFTITRGGDIAVATSVNWQVSGTGAQSAGGNDFLDGLFPSGTATFAPNERSVTQSIEILGDTIRESDETFAISLVAGPAGTTIVGPPLVVLLRDDDGVAPTNGADVITGTGGGDTVDALHGDDRVFGLAGADHLVGGPGRDTLHGGDGNDRFVVDDIGDQIIETRTGGADTVYAPVTWTLGAHLEDLVLTGNAAIDGTGNNLANVITGNDAANTLLGGGRADTLIGGGGNDLYLIDATDLLVEQAGGGLDTVVANATFTLSDHIEVLRFNGTANVRGDGNAGNNFILGNVGNNRLLGHDGNDTLNGGLGNDTLQGGEGADSLVGGEGVDRLDGGNGDDTYILTDADAVIEAPNAGIDTVLSAISYTLPGAVENLSLLNSTDLSGTGNALANVLNGNGGANLLRGLAEADRVSGGGGADTIEGGAGADTLTGGAGPDRFLWLTPAEGSDTVVDFRPGEDKLAFLAGSFGGLALLTLSQNAAAGGSAQFVYTKATGVLEWDADGSGAGAAAIIATLSNKPTLAAADFVIVA